MEDQTILFHRSRSCDVSSSSTPGARSCERRPSFNIKRRIVADSVKRTMEEGHDLKLSSPKSNGGFGADTTAANRSSGKRSPNSLDRGIQQRSPNGLQRIASSRQQDAETLSADLSNSIQYSSPKTSFNFDGISLADIQHSSTFDSSDGSESEIIGFDENDVATEYATNNRRESIGQYACSTSQASDSLRININEELSESVAEQQRCPDLSWSEWLHHASYISTLGILGTVLRMYMERFFGLDCEMKSSKPVNDFFERISSNVCVTASGTTNQTGGALFTSLPANMLGW